ncbi:glutamate--tRNA ligase [Candidatus Cyanaurora vandensis]|uniref:glutamate--tRNA ligase n=1 Tax=Candidatus Cyanaurora vandensis TaxID=2714958 RepID=UPI00257B6BAF|nr:glutamate--tRNA ligase [Candidatus Cyanaurora vandensis]
MSVRVRIAPSPTGNLHIGTARTALFNYLFARSQGGKFILRIEDTDQERSRPEYTRNIIQGLTWLGLDFDEGPYYQTQRLDRYQTVIQQLLAAGQAYYCFCTAEELDDLRTRQKALGQANRYDNRHRDLTVAQQQAFRDQGREPVVRFKIEEPRTVRWSDLVQDEVVWQTQDLGGDMVIARADGGPLYNFAVVVDDWDMQISHVIRGDDHVGNTPKQILLYEALAAPLPQFAHLPLIHNPEGKKLSKRDGATSLADFQNLGFIPEGLINYLAMLSWSPPSDHEIFSLAEAYAMFGFERVSKSPARFDWDKLTWLNGQHLRLLKPEDLTQRLVQTWTQVGYDLPKQPEDAAWLTRCAQLVGEGLNRMDEAARVARPLFEPVAFTNEGLQVLLKPEAPKILLALLTLFQDPPQVEELKAQLQTLAKTLGLKNGPVMQTLRIALTGTPRGLELAPLALLLHQRQAVIPRLQVALDLVQQFQKGTGGVK